MDHTHSKREVSLRYWLQGRNYTVALRAMNLGKQYHTGIRKDGVTPEFDHQVSIAHYLRTLDGSLLYPQETYAAALLHDVREDYGLADAEIRDLFGDRTADAVHALSKEFRGKRLPEAEVFAMIADDPIASVVKGCDRIHNHQSMVGVFSTQKQVEYIEETNDWFFPMLKQARRAFPEQEPAYENVKTMLKSQIHLIEAIHGALDRGPEHETPEI